VIKLIRNVKKLYVKEGDKMDLNICAIKKLMVERQMTAKALANKANIAPATLSNIFRKNSAQYKSIGRIAAALNVKPEKILLLAQD